RKFRVRAVPLAVLANADESAGPDHAPGRGLQEQFGPLGRVDLVVERCGPGRFLLAGDLAPLVGDTGGPDLLPTNRSAEYELVERFARLALGEQLAREPCRVRSREQVAQHRRPGEEMTAAVLECADRGRSIGTANFGELHRRAWVAG